MEITTKYVEAHLFRVKNNELEFLVLKRSDTESYPGLWQPVTGSVCDGEKAYQTAIREIKEETGLVPEKLWVAPNVNSFYSHKDDKIYLVPVFAAKVIFTPNIELSCEHSEFLWVGVEKAKSLFSVKAQRDSVEQIVEYFTDKNSMSRFNEIKNFV